MTASYEDAEAVRSTVVAVAHLIDHKRWAELQKLFAAAVRTDYTSLFGGTPEEQKAGALVDGWRGSLGKVATQHLLGPIALHVTGAAARASCHVRALHHAPGASGGPTWEVLGHYEFDLARGTEGWTITGLTLQTFVQTGNTKLLSEAEGAAR
ncbi:MAG: nuclear transport factor 2 family protein [Gemmatimonadaceae bacterium]